ARLAPTSNSGGRVSRQRSRTYGQRGESRQPAGRSNAPGTTPASEASRRRPALRSGSEASNASVYGCRGRANRSAAVALSTIWPAYITRTRCATSATTPRSWVMRTSAMPRSRCRRSRRASICACTVTSRAVVGSSAMSRRGSQAIAIASMTRWLMPPESWCGKASRRRSGSGISTSFSSCSARARRAARDPPSCSPIVSISWNATVNDGLRLVIGSWKIIAISPPRRSRRSRPLIACRSRPAKARRSARTRPGSSMRPRTASAVTLFPEPDSPTMPTTSPASTEKLTSSTATSAASPTGKSTVSPRTSRRLGSAFTALPLQLRVESVAQAITGEVERQHGDEDRQAGKRHDPPCALDELERARQHRAPFGRRRLRAETEEAERGGVEDRRREAEGRLDDERRGAVGQHGVEHQACGAGAGEARGLHVVLGELAEDGAARQANEVRQHDDGDREHGVRQPRAENGDHRDREQQVRQREHHVHQAHDGVLRPAAVGEAGDEAEEDADRERQADRHQADDERQARAVDEAREDVAADRVGAEDEDVAADGGERRRAQRRVAELLARVVRRDDVREQRAEDEQAEHREADDRAAIAAEVPP